MTANEFHLEFTGSALGMLGQPAQTAAAAEPIAGPWWAGLILWLPAAAAVLCALCAAARVRNRLPAWITAFLLGASFLLTLILYMSYETGAPLRIHMFDWFNIHWSGGNGHAFIADFSLYVDSLTLLWMLFVTGLGTLIGIYSAEYMEADVNSAGYARYFAGFSIFVFAMSALVMADNLVMLYLGWEGVGFASYYLIGYAYQRPSAVAAAKKAFIVNRIGDLGLALAIWFIYLNFGTVQFAELFAILASPDFPREAGGWTVDAIPYLLMLGAAGKSAQIPLYVWLPDAMEGPTPVSALIHAATMVTAGVYLVCRMFPVMELHPAALPTVAWIGALTALLAASIGMAQYDMKRIWAYSTISQLGYMFAGVGVLTTFGAAYHVFTHAFFKAVLFLTAGAVMHGFAGQLDIRRVSGLAKMPGWGITSWTMLYAAACLAGVPVISNGFWSKDMIMAEAFLRPDASFIVLGLILLVTALMTAYYTFRVFFRVCTGPVQYEMGEDDHGGHDEGREGTPAGRGAHGAGRHPHPPRLAINAVLVIITLGAVGSIFLKPWAGTMVADSSAAGGVPHEHHGEPASFWAASHQWMPWIAGTMALLGIAIAWWFHLRNRRAAEAWRARLLASRTTRWLPRALENKWYVDEIYHALIRAPLWVIGHVCFLFDKLIVDGLIVDTVFGKTPRGLGRIFRPLQSGLLHDYARAMIGAAALVILFVWLMKSGVLNWLARDGALAAGLLGAL